MSYKLIWMKKTRLVTVTFSRTYSLILLAYSVL